MMAAELISAKSIIHGIRTVQNSFARNITYGTTALAAVIDNNHGKEYYEKRSIWLDNNNDFCSIAND